MFLSSKDALIIVSSKEIPPVLGAVSQELDDDHIYKSNVFL